MVRAATSQPPSASKFARKRSGWPWLAAYSFLPAVFLRCGTCSTPASGGSTTVRNVHASSGRGCPGLRKGQSQQDHCLRVEPPREHHEGSHQEHHEEVEGN